MPLSASPVEQLAQRLGRKWESIHGARVRTAALLRQLAELVRGFESDDRSFVTFGSLARGEFTSGSDVDWTLLVDGQATTEHIDASLAIRAELENHGFRPPGREGTFGTLAFSHDLIHYIGGSEDDNANMTRRLLLLLESLAPGRGDAHLRTVRVLLSRYIIEDFGWMNTRNPFNVPRFLQNDIARYWRTIAVDFAYKRRAREGEGWALRTAKLRLSRKLIYVSGLLICFSCATDERISEVTARPGDAAAAHAVVDFLASFVGRYPLDIVAQVLGGYPRLDTHTALLFDTYNTFLSVLDNDAKRKHLQDLTKEDIAVDALYEQIRTVSHDFQKALTAIFLEENGTPFYDLTKAYGVF